MANMSFETRAEGGPKRSSFHGPRSKFLTRTQRAQLRREYAAPGDDRVVRILDQLDWLEARLAEAVEEVREMQARLRRRVSPDG